MRPTPEQLIADFVDIARLAHVELSERDIHVEVLSAPHRPPAAIPTGKMAVYAFFWQGLCLKVGKVGPRSHARYVSQHYSPGSSRSNLAKSILKHKAALGLDKLDERAVGDWIRANTTRVNLIMDSALGLPVLGLLEVFLQCRLRPRFEGSPN